MYGDGQGGRACCSPWGHKELDTTEQLNWTEDKEAEAQRNSLCVQETSINKGTDEGLWDSAVQYGSH